MVGGASGIRAQGRLKEFRGVYLLVGTEVSRRLEDLSYVGRRCFRAITSHEGKKLHKAGGSVGVTANCSVARLVLRSVSQ